MLIYHSEKAKYSDERLLGKILKTGTSKDKLAAIVIKLTEAPLLRISESF